ncbi:unnamed protein product [Schistosoma curassoni]|uniref:Reverse transcriptase domain-containing protein n=1 Tax=Schistosoma curassoni TaxID=6186 RepID=A0A183KGE4_9TREM|nr:unnamed protein product [Schistosoma curassoni]
MICQNDQKIREFILEMQKKAFKCNIGGQRHVQLTDQLIAGINIPGLERELLEMPNCSFQDARTACVNYEAVNELDIQSMKISNNLLSHHDEIQSQGQSNLHLIATCAKCSGGMKIQRIQLQVQGDPVFLKRRVIPYGLQEAVHKTLNDLCAKDIIEIIQSSAYGASIVTPRKSDGKTPRICSDYRLTLNSRLLNQMCTAVEAEDVLNRLHSSKVFSKIDPTDAYLQNLLDQSSSILTTIKTPFSLFKCKFLPFGPCCSPAIFQEVMNKVVSDLEGVEVYQDDLIAHDCDEECREISDANSRCQLQEQGESVPIPVVNYNANEYTLDNTNSLSDTLSDRHRMNLRTKRTIDHRHLDSNLSSDGCGVYMN